MIVKHSQILARQDLRSSIDMQSDLRINEIEKQHSDVFILHDVSHTCHHTISPDIRVSQ